MGPRDSLLRNTLALLIPNAVNPFLSFLLVLVISRYLGVEGLGEYSLLLSFSLIFTTVASLGLGDLVVRQVTRKPEDVHSFFLNCVLFGLASSLLAMCAMNLLIFAMGYNQEVMQAAFVCAFSLIPATAIRYIESIFRAVERSEFIAAGFVVENTLRVVLCIPLVLYGYGIITVFLAILFTRVIGFCFMFYCYIQINGVPRWTLKPEVWLLLLKEAPTFTGIAIFSTLHLNMANLMLSKLQSIEAVGIYSAAGRITSIFETIPLAFALAVLPMLTRKSSSGMDDLKESSVLSLRYIFLAVFPMVAGVMVLGDEIILLIYGNKFASAGAVLKLQAVTMIPLSMVVILARLLIATDNQKVDLLINLAAVITSFVLNYLLIPKFGEMGAVSAVLLTIVIFNHLQYIYIRRLLFKIPFWHILKNPLLAALGMSVGTLLLKDWNIFVNIALSALVYCLLLIVLKEFSPEEMVDLKRFLGFDKTLNGR